MNAIDQLPEDARTLIREARSNEDFHCVHSDCLTGTGERSVDLMVYRFALANGQDLQMSFVDFSFDTYALVERELEQDDDDSPELSFESDLPDPNR